jgi:hypothetical protein
MNSEVIEEVVPFLELLKAAALITYEELRPSGGLRVVVLDIVKILYGWN